MNWDPVDMTVLANEQVIDGRGWRSGAVVEQRELTQWFFKISDYSEDLLQAIDGLDRWPEKVRTDAAQLDRQVRRPAPAVRARRGPATATTPSRSSPPGRTPSSAPASSRCRPTIRWPTELAEDGIPRSPEFIDECHRHGTATEAIEKAEKKGIFTGLTVKHPVKPGQTLPVYVANFVLMDYGTGAIFGCPAHDQRDLDFARKYGLPVIPVVLPERRRSGELCRRRRGLYRPRHASITSDFLDGLDDRGGQEEAAAAHFGARTVDGNRRRASSRSTIACATGAFRASATGAARSR